MFDGTAYDATYVPVASRVKLTRVGPAIGAKSGAERTRAVRFTEGASRGPFESPTSTSTDTISPGRATPGEGTTRSPGRNRWNTTACPESGVPSTVALTTTADGWLWNTKAPVNTPTDCRVRLSGERPGNRSTYAPIADGSVSIPRSKTYVVTFTLSPNSAAGRSTRTMTSTAFVRARAPGPAPIVNRRNAAVTKTPSRTGDPCLARPSQGQKVMVGIRTYCTPLTDCRVRVGHGVPDRRTMLSDRLNADRALTADRFHRPCAAIINSGRFLEIGHAALGRHDRRWRDPRDLVRVLAREPLRRPNRRPREGITGRDPHVAPEHRRGAPTVLPRPRRAKGLRAVVPGRVQDVEGVCGGTPPAMVARRNVRGRDPRRSVVSPRAVPGLGPGQRDGRRRTRPPDRGGRATTRAERPLPRCDLVEDGYGRRLSGVHAVASGGSGTRGRQVPPRLRRRINRCGGRPPRDPARSRNRHGPRLRGPAREDSRKRRPPGRIGADPVPDQRGRRPLDRHRARAGRRPGVHGPSFSRRVLGGRRGVASPVQPEHLHGPAASGAPVPGSALDRPCGRTAGDRAQRRPGTGPVHVSRALRRSRRGRAKVV